MSLCYIYVRVHKYDHTHLRQGNENHKRQHRDMELQGILQLCKEHARGERISWAGKDL